jgi:hypothetical protein
MFNTKFGTDIFCAYRKHLMSLLAAELRGIKPHTANQEFGADLSLGSKSAWGYLKPGGLR